LIKELIPGVGEGGEDCWSLDIIGCAGQGQVKTIVAITS